ncbi:MAG: hypothetical protein AB2A00_18715 [Myxococcota bacterium]
MRLVVLCPVVPATRPEDVRVAGGYGVQAPWMRSLPVERPNVRCSPQLSTNQGGFNLR